MKYIKFRKTKHYSFSELYGQGVQLKRHFNVEHLELNHGKLEAILKLKPTEESIEYKVKLIARKYRITVKVFIIEPKITLVENNKKVPHLYPDCSLCLYYPKKNEFNYKDAWTKTIIPWTSLWLYYYEVWKETGCWLGGGIHANEFIPMG